MVHFLNSYKLGFPDFKLIFDMQSLLVDITDDLNNWKWLEFVTLKVDKFNYCLFCTCES